MPSTFEALLRLRRAGPSDAAAVRALSRTAYAKWVPLIGREPRPMTADYDRAVVEHRIDLVEQDGTLVALIETELRPHDLLVVNLAVDPAHQGQGLGRRLLAHAETVAAEAGRATVRLYTNERMTGNVPLYTGLGYAVERTEMLDVGRVIHMVRHRAAVP